MSRFGETWNDPDREERERRERKIAPPIEREHETWQGVVEEDEKRARKDEKREREGGHEPERG
jgi:hypothetical protein